MANAAIAANALHALEVHADLASEVALDHVLALLDRVHDCGELFLAQIFGADAAVNIRLLKDLEGVDRTDAVDVAERNVDSLVRRDVDSDDAWHIGLTLALLVADVLADDANDALPPDDPALLTKLLD